MKKNKKEEKFSKQFINNAIVVAVVALIIGCGVGMSFANNKNYDKSLNNNTNLKNDNKKTNDTKKDNTKKEDTKKEDKPVVTPPKEEIKITKSVTSTIEYDTFNNGLVSFKYPRGWKVVIPKVDYIHYTFKVYDPKNPTYRFLFMMKLEGFNKSSAAKKWQKKYYPKSMFAKAPVISKKTTAGFYKIWNQTVKYVNKNDLKTNYLPKLNKFKVVQNLGKNGKIGGHILRATFKDSNNKLAQGLFTASVKSAGKYYVNSNVWNLRSKKIDVFPLNVYNIIMMSAPDEEFNNWQPILDKCIGSIEFSKKFIQGFNKEEKQLMATIQANQRIYDQISDMIMDSWNKRNSSYDIISQKRSDATLGYERVYDTQTGDIYKAYNGFMDDYSGSRYQTITDDMYTSAISGYIEK